jgi:hypothetical protein
VISVRQRVFPGLVGLLTLGLLGCGGSGPRYAGVSGVVTLDGKPYKGAVVNFQPSATPDNPNPGRGSYGHTDENGRFTLVVDDKVKGAVVGKHRVRIASLLDAAPPEVDPALGTPDGGDRKGRPKRPVDPIPPEWNESSTKEFDVPPGGTDQANFDIVTRAGGKKK